jgi:hypothetical protein
VRINVRQVSSPFLRFFSFDRRGDRGESKIFVLLKDAMGNGIRLFLILRVSDFSKINTLFWNQGRSFTCSVAAPSQYFRGVLAFEGEDSFVLTYSLGTDETLLT